MGLLTDTQNCRLCMRRECRERFPRHRLQRNPLVSDPTMHHGTCGTHVPWCMSGSQIHGGGENVLVIPGEWATRNFAYLARGPYRDPFHHQRVYNGPCFIMRGVLKHSQVPHSLCYTGTCVYVKWFWTIWDLIFHCVCCTVLNELCVQGFVMGFLVVFGAVDEPLAHYVSVQLMEDLFLVGLYVGSIEWRIV